MNKYVYVLNEKEEINYDRKDQLTLLINIVERKYQINQLYGNQNRP